MKCQTCTHFVAGKSAGGGVEIMMGYALAGRFPQPSAVAAGIFADKDGACCLLPTPVPKRKGDICGQHAERAKAPERGR
jgi:hypothetical protein